MRKSTSSVLNTLDRHGVAVAVARLLDEPPRELVTTCREVTIELFLSRRDVVAGWLIGWPGSVEVERLARRAPAIHGLDREFLDHARSLYATLGSLLWPGWGRQGLRIDRTALAAGRHAAERAHQLTVEIGADDLTVARSRWLVAVHALFAEDLEAARLQLIEASKLTERAGATDENKLVRAYLLMVQERGQPEDPEIGYEIDRIRAEFEKEPGTVEFGEQLSTARSVLGGMAPGEIADSVADAEDVLP